MKAQNKIKETEKIGISANTSCIFRNTQPIPSSENYYQMIDNMLRALEETRPRKMSRAELMIQITKIILGIIAISLIIWKL